MVQIPQEHNRYTHVEHWIYEAKDSPNLGNEINVIKILISYLLLSKIKINIQN